MKNLQLLFELDMMGKENIILKCSINDNEMFSLDEENEKLANMVRRLKKNHQFKNLEAQCQRVIEPLQRKEDLIYYKCKRLRCIKYTYIIFFF